MGYSLHAFANDAQVMQQYSRNEPLHAGNVEHNSIPAGVGVYDTNTYRYTAQVAQRVRATANVLHDKPAMGGSINVWIMKNQLPTVVGQVGGEIAGDDVVVYQPNAQNATARVDRIITLQPGEWICAVPGASGGGKLTNGVAGNGNNTVNYFEVEVLEIM